MGLRIDVDKGLVLLVTAPYDETIVDWIRTLPERRYRHESQDWIVPALREQLRTLCSFIGELEERGIAVKISDDAGVRMARVDVGRARCAMASSRSRAHTASADCRRYARCPSAALTPTARSGPSH